VRLSSLEALAEKWTIAHTISLAAWVAVLVLGIFLIFRPSGSSYPKTDILKTYAGENATFTYPENWTVGNCGLDEPFLELPGTIESEYKGKRSYPLAIYGTGAYNCMKDRPQRFDIYPENLKASDNPCAPSASTEGERLDNGLYFEVKEQGEHVVAVHIKQNNCYAPADTVVLGFAFVDPEMQVGDDVEFGMPTVNKEIFLKSPQYADMHSLAQSIRY